MVSPGRGVGGGAHPAVTGETEGGVQKVSKKNGVTEKKEDLKGLSHGLEVDLVRAEVNTMSSAISEDLLCC
jgi:hypothetical protein